MNVAAIVIIAFAATGILLMRFRKRSLATLYDRKELLRVIRDNLFPDQTGVEEADNNKQSAQENMMKWLLERGQFTAEHYASFIDDVKAV